MSYPGQACFYGIHPSQIEQFLLNREISDVSFLPCLSSAGSYPCVCCKIARMPPRTTTSIPVASRIGGFVYAIRNIVAEARRVEAAGTRVRYLNIGDPITFGFQTPPHLVEAVERALVDGHNGYAPSVGIAAAREAVADECARRGMPLSADRVILTSGTSEGIELALTALAEAGDEVLVPVPTYPLYTAVLAKIGARAVFYRTDAVKRMAAGSRSRPQPDHAGHASARGHRPEQSDRSGVSARCAARAGRPRRRARHSAPRRRGLRGSRLRRSASRRSRRTIRTRRSSRSHRCPRPISRPAGGPAGWLSAAPSGWTTCWQR